MVIVNSKKVLSTRNATCASLSSGPSISTMFMLVSPPMSCTPASILSEFWHAALSPGFNAFASVSNALEDHNKNKQTRKLRDHFHLGGPCTSEICILDVWFKEPDVENRSQEYAFPATPPNRIPEKPNLQWL